MHGTEMIIRFAGRQYCATLLIDGQVNRRTVLGKWPEMAVWARQVRQELGTDIYARLKTVNTKGMRTILALARFLGGEGFTVGIETFRRHCSPPPLAATTIND
jgi:hypothetical protein